MNNNAKTQTESLDFIQSMLLQLSQMAKSEQCDMLAYLIEMSYVECSELLRNRKSPLLDHQKRNSAA